MAHLAFESLSSTQIPTFPALGLGVLHSSSGGVVSSSLVTGADIANSTVTNANLITLTTPGLVANTATTATPLNTRRMRIVSRDASNNFAAGTITASLTGAASLNLLLTGGALSGAILVPAGSSSTPSVQVGLASVGLSEASGALQLSTNATLAMSLSATQIPTFPALGLGVLHSSSGGVVSSSLVTGADIANATVTNANFDQL